MTLHCVRIACVLSVILAVAGFEAQATANDALPAGDANSFSFSPPATDHAVTLMLRAGRASGAPFPFPWVPEVSGQGALVRAQYSARLSENWSMDLRWAWGIVGVEQPAGATLTRRVLGSPVVTAQQSVSLAPPVGSRTVGARCWLAHRFRGGQLRSHKSPHGCQSPRAVGPVGSQHLIARRV